MYKMSKNSKYKITIVMLNAYGNGYTKSMNNFLKKFHAYSYNDTTTVGDLYKWALKCMKCKQKFNLIKIFQIKINDKEIYVQPNFNLKKFIKLNKLSKLEINFRYSTGGGCDLKIGVLANIRINPNEKQHRYIPHVHIYRGKSRAYDNETRINLDDMSVMKNTQKSLHDLFNKKESELLSAFLWKYRDDLIKYYNSIQKGENPEPIYIDYEGNRTYFC